eukprot:TRINITY_DN68727_c0_g1_i1.p1 TRINITY_DN68727_c0_g1~~TRINITY_DN68727_c0_g1_i1.p1  ORF type:complete len:265 (-),score=52.82 TRINITY_DN68727_c0_g1_i1:45-839(-)
MFGFACCCQPDNEPSFLEVTTTGVMAGVDDRMKALKSILPDDCDILEYQDALSPTATPEDQKPDAKSVDSAAPPRNAALSALFTTYEVDLQHIYLDAELYLSEEERLFPFLLIQEVTGVLDEWNRKPSTRKERQVKAMDRIVALNGVAGLPKELLAKLRQIQEGTGVVKMTLERPRYLAVVLRGKTGKKIGLQVELVGGYGLWIQKVERIGMIADFNSKAPDRLKIKANDFIIKVGGQVITSVRQLVEAMSLQEEVKLTVRCWS